MSASRRARPLASIRVTRPDVVNLVSDEDSDVSASPFENLIKCPIGHTFFPKANSSDCPFCIGSLRKYRDYASGKGGRLLNKAFQEVLSFKCHRPDHPEFSLSMNIMRSNSSIWCPLCSRTSRPSQYTSTAFNEARRNIRDNEKRRFDELLEENKRHQAGLLSSAKQLYKITSGSSSSRLHQSPRHHICSSVRDLVKRDLEKYSDVTEEQCILVRSILACKTKPSECWSMIASVLEVPKTTAKEKLFRKSAKLVHPDKCKHPESDEAFKTLNSFINSSN